MLKKRAQIIVIGNEKGGSGKSTTALHITVGMLRAGLSVASIDLDGRQGSLTRFFELRRYFATKSNLKLTHPVHTSISPLALTTTPEERDISLKKLENLIQQLSTEHDILVIDTPGSDSVQSKLAHVMADTLITPINDSFIDLDVIAILNPDTLELTRPSHYAEMVWQQRKKRAAHGLKATDWIIMRNRLSSLGSVSKREMNDVLQKLQQRFGFQLLSGFGERAIFRELFLKGLTILDMKGDDAGDEGLSMSHIAARQEVRNLIALIRELHQKQPL